MNSRRMRAQSAMEYLMTYGWAILIIAVVLGALFSLGVFSGSALLGTTCIAQSGYLCSSMSFSHTYADIGLTFGQNTGTTWTGYVLGFAPQGIATTSGIPQIPANAYYTATASTTLPSGGSTTIAAASGINTVSSAGVLQIPANTGVGTQIVGTLWACYVTTGTITTSGVAFTALSGCNYVAVATLSAKAT